MAVIAALASVTAAVIAGLFARASRRYEARVQRSDQAHDRISEQQLSMYAPVVDMLERMFTTSAVPTPDELKHKQHFDTWVNVYGSDGAVGANSRLMQALPLAPPAALQFRLYADFLLEVRKDIGDPHSTVDRLQISDRGWQGSPTGGASPSRTSMWCAGVSDGHPHGVPADNGQC